MSRFLDILAKTVSVVLYPLFIPTYGVGLFCYAHGIHIAPLNGIWIAVVITATFLLTCLLPITAIWIMMRKGSVKDFNIDNAEERTIPYIYSAIGFGFWSYFLVSILHAPIFLSYIAIGATFAIAVIAIINSHWKISAHLTGLGGLVGGIFCYCLGISAIPTWGTFGLWFGITLLLMWARLRVNAHTPAQVAAGWLMGLSCTFLPYCIYAYLA